MEGTQQEENKNIFEGLPKMKRRIDYARGYFVGEVRSKYNKLKEKEAELKEGEFLSKKDSRKLEKYESMIEKIKKNREFMASHFKYDKSVCKGGFVVKNKKIGRNDICCELGKKYKYCCLNKGGVDEVEDSE